MPALTPEEIRTYEEDGYVVPSYRVPEERMAALAAAAEEVIAANSDTRPEQLPNIHITNGSGTHLKGHPAFLDFALDEDLLDLVSGVIGEDIVMWGCQIFCKPGSDGMEVPMHQDGQYWPIRPLATCTVWIAIDASTTANGCLRVIPGSHLRHELRSHHRSTRSDVVLDQELDAEVFDEAAARDVELQPGQMSLHDVYLIHGSHANSSPRRRAGLALRYMPATSHFDRGLLQPGSSTSTYVVDFSQRPIWLVRGVDRSGRNDFQIGHDSKQGKERAT